ncbi:MAG: response regulator [Burkholderiaceae bacterium]
MINILVVEDDRLSRVFLAAGLRQLGGFDITDTDSAEAAWTLWSIDRFDVVLSDIELPGMDGVALARRIRDDEQQRGAQHPVHLVALTGSLAKPENTDRVEAVFDVVLHKPIGIESLAMILNDRVLNNPVFSNTRLSHGASSGSQDVDPCRGST